MLTAGLCQTRIVPLEMEVRGRIAAMCCTQTLKRRSLLLVIPTQAHHFRSQDVVPNTTGRVYRLILKLNSLVLSLLARSQTAHPA